MYGSNIGQLNVLLQTMPIALDNVTSSTVWTKSRTQGNFWYRGSITLHQLNATNMFGWRVAFEGIVGGGFLGDIALDDIFLSSSSCPPSRTCDFELGLCDFTPNPPFSWKQQQANNFSEYFIEQDHTLSTSFGNLALANADSAK